VAYFTLFTSSVKKVNNIYVATDSTIVKFYFEKETLHIPVKPGYIEVEVLASKNDILPGIPIVRSSKGTTYVPGIYYKNFLGKISNYSTAYVLDFNRYFRIDVLDNEIKFSEINEHQKNLPKGLYELLEKGVWNNKRGIYLNN